MGRFIRRLILDDRGQSTTEYILILAVVVMVVMKFKGIFVEKILGAAGKLGTDIETAAGSGSSSN